MDRRPDGGFRGADTRRTHSNPCNAEEVPLPDHSGKESPPPHRIFRVGYLLQPASTSARQKPLLAELGSPAQLKVTQELHQPRGDRGRGRSPRSPPAPSSHPRGGRRSLEAWDVEGEDSSSPPTAYPLRLVPWLALHRKERVAPVPIKKSSHPLACQSNPMCRIHRQGSPVPHTQISDERVLCRAIFSQSESMRMIDAGRTGRPLSMF